MNKFFKIKTKLYLGLDIGGTKIKAGIIDKSGKVYSKIAVPTAAMSGKEAFYESVFLAIDKVTDNIGIENITAIGVAAAGFIDDEKGLIVCSGNIAVDNLPLQKAIEDRYKLPCRMTNDANAAAYGEVCFGSAKGLKNAVMLTLGTGVGSGIIIDGKIYAGNRSSGAEMGHMIIVKDGEPCTCGSCGCFEAYASATALIRDTKKAISENPDSLMKEALNDRISARTPFLYCDRDETARKVVNNYVDYLAVGVASIVNIFRPQTIILGGGISNEGDKLINPLNERMRKSTFARGLAPDVPIIQAKLGNDAGFIGAASLMFSK